MKTQGTFFLRGTPTPIRFPAADGTTVLGWLLPLGERQGQRGVEKLTAYWRGPEADAFVRANPALKAGDCLVVEVGRLHAADNELCGFVTSCVLAPARWQAPAARMTTARQHAEH